MRPQRPETGGDKAIHPVREKSVQNHKTSIQRYWRPGVCALGLLWAGTCPASGFLLIEQSVSAMGGAYAGGAALAEDASTLFFNPAGMTRLTAPEAVAGVHLVAPSAQFHDQGSRDLVRLFGTGLGHNDGGDAGVPSAIPNLYYVHPVSDRLALGMGITSPFGLTTEYDQGWMGRYHAGRSQLTTVNLNPSIAFRLTDQISLGAGLDYQYLKADLSNAVDVAGVLPLLGRPLAGRLDSNLDIKGDGQAWGYNVGALLELHDGTRIGAHYRSGLDYQVRGRADVTLVNGPKISSRPAGLLHDVPARSDTSMPALASLSLFHPLNDRWALMADVTWTDWSCLQALVFEFGGILPTGSEVINWKDTFRYSLGAEYRPNKQWVWRAGVALDQAPVPNPQSRTPRIPDNDRLWLAAGFGYQWSERLGIDVGFAHLFVPDPRIDRVDSLGVAVLKGKYDAHVDILSAQLRWRFL